MGRKEIKGYEDLYQALMAGNTLIRRFSSFRLSLPSKQNVPHWIAKHMVASGALMRCAKNSYFFEQEWKLPLKRYKTFKEWTLDDKHDRLDDVHKKMKDICLNGEKITVLNKWKSFQCK